MTEERTESLVDTPAPLAEEPPSLGRAFGIRSWLQDLLETLLLAVIIFLVINTLTGRYQVHGQSMEPSLHDGQYLIASKVTYWLHPPERGDIIVLEPPDGSAIPYIKRVVGLPGDHVQARDGRIWVNGIPLHEPYIHSAPEYTGEWFLGANEYFVLGDNRNNSSDSHRWGMLSVDNIIGKSIFCYWPPNCWGVIPHFTFPELTSQP